jgi:hypothetical protein
LRGGTRAAITSGGTVNMPTHRIVLKPLASGWQLEHNGAPIAVHETRDDARTEAQRLASTLHGELVFVDAGGHLLNRERFGREVRDGKG